MTGAELRAWRRERSLTQAQIAGWLAVHRLTVLRWEAGAPPSWVPLVLAAHEAQRSPTAGGR